MTEHEQKADENGHTRRELGRKIVTVGAATLSVPAFVDVTRAATASGNPELTTTATIPTAGTVTVKILEDTDGDGTAENTESNTIPDGTDQITEYSTLTGTEADTYTYWMDITFDTTDTSVTPELDSATLTLPAESTTSTSTATPTPTATVAPSSEPPQSEPLGLFGIFESFLGYVTFYVMAITMIGLGSKSLAIGALGGYLSFAYFAIQTQNQLLQNILIVTLALILIGFAFKFWRLEGPGE